MESLILRVGCVDDYHLLNLHAAGCSFYPRAGLMNSISMGLCAYSLEADRKLIFGTMGNLAESAEQRSYNFVIDKFTAGDYAALSRVWLGKKADALDFQKIFRFAPKLNAHQIKAACKWLAENPPLTTEVFIEYRRVEMRPPTGYFLQAVEGVRENKKRLMEAETQATAKAQPHGAPFNSYVFNRALAGESV